MMRSRRRSPDTIRRLRGLLQLRLADPPLVALATDRATGPNPLATDAQQSLEFAVDADVDILPGVGADEMQAFHFRLRTTDEAPLEVLFRS